MEPEKKVGPLDDPEARQSFKEGLHDAACGMFFTDKTCGWSAVHGRLCSYFASRFEEITPESLRLLLESCALGPVHEWSLIPACEGLRSAALKIRQHVEENTHRSHPAHQLNGIRNRLLPEHERIGHGNFPPIRREDISDVLCTLLLMYGLGTADAVTAGAGTPEDALAAIIGESFAVASVHRATAGIVAEKVFWAEDAFRTARSKQGSSAE